MTTTPSFARFNSLIAMGGRHGIDMKPILLRVLTDLYAQTPHHSDEEQRQFVELTGRLIEAVDPDTRRAIAERFARCPHAPPDVLARLRADGPQAVASPQEPDDPQAAPVPEDRPVPQEHFVPKEQAASEDATPQGRAPRPASPGLRDTATTAAPGKDQAAVDLCDLFFASSPAERRLIITNLDVAATPAATPDPARTEATTQRFERAVLSGRGGDFVRELEAALDVSREIAQRIVNDRLGEPLVGALRALSVPVHVVQRILLFVNPAIGHSVRRVFELSALYDEISPASARRLVESWQRASRATRPPEPAPTPLRADPRAQPAQHRVRQSSERPAVQRTT